MTDSLNFEAKREELRQGAAEAVKLYNEAEKLYLEITRTNLIFKATAPINWDPHIWRLEHLKEQLKTIEDNGEKVDSQLILNQVGNAKVDVDKLISDLTARGFQPSDNLARAFDRIVDAYNHETSELINKRKSGIWGFR